MKIQWVLIWLFDIPTGFSKTQHPAVIERALRAEPTVGWPRAEQVRDKYYFDEIFFYLHLYTGKIVTNATCERYSSIIALARDSDPTSTLMTVLTDRLKMYLKPAAL